MVTRIDTTTGRCTACDSGHYEACEGLPCKIAILREHRGLPQTVRDAIAVRDARAALVGLGFALANVTYVLEPFTDADGMIDADSLATVYRTLRTAATVTGTEVPA